MDSAMGAPLANAREPHRMRTIAWWFLKREFTRNSQPCQMRYEARWILSREVRRNPGRPAPGASI
jgi:hypothetical protein